MLAPPGGGPRPAIGLLVVVAAVSLAVGAATASTGRRDTVILRPGHSKKIGSHTIVCSAGRGGRTKTRIVLPVGFQVTVNHVVVRCAAATTPKPTPIPTPQPPAQGTLVNPYPLGTAGTAQGSSVFTPGATWTITVDSTNPDAWSVVQAANEFNSPPPAGSVDFLVNLTVTLNGTQAVDISDVAAYLEAVGSAGVGYGIGNNCGVLPSPSEIDYTNVFPGATFNLNYCWQVTQTDAASLKMYWSAGSSPGPFWALH